MKQVMRWVIWLVQLASLIVLVISAYMVLDTPLFAAFSATVTLVTSLYVEHASGLDRTEESHDE